jgi:hypothetical protein
VILEGNTTLYEMRAHFQSVGVSVHAVRGVYLSNRHYLSTDSLDRLETGYFRLKDERFGPFSGGNSYLIEIPVGG